MASEKRSICTEVRAESDGTKYQLTGTAVRYGVLSAPIGQFRERFLPGSLTRSLASGEDVKLLWSHDSGTVLARSKIKSGVGSLQLTDTPSGLSFRAQLNPDSPAHRSAYESCRTGCTDEMSFGFVVPPGGDSYDNADDEGKRFLRRSVREANLQEISVVAWPAYTTGTSVQARAERRSAMQYVIAPPSDVRPYTRMEADFLIDQLNRRRASEQAAAIRSGALAPLMVNTFHASSGDAEDETLYQRDDESDESDAMRKHCDNCDGVGCAGVAFVEGERSARSTLHCDNCDDDECDGVGYIEDDEKE